MMMMICVTRLLVHRFWESSEECVYYIHTVLIKVVGTAWRRKKASSLDARSCYERWEIFERFPRVVHQWCCYESFRWLTILFFSVFKTRREIWVVYEKVVHEFEYARNISCNLHSSKLSRIFINRKFAFVSLWIVPPRPDQLSAIIIIATS